MITRRAILVLPGDGVGPEVVAEAVRVLTALQSDGRLEISFEYGDIGGAAIDLGQGPLPRETLDRAQLADAVLLGAVGGPRWDHLPVEHRPERGLLELRSALGVFANLRPVRVLPGLARVSPLREELAVETDLLIVRELTGGLYFGQPRVRSSDEAVDTLRYRRDEVARVARVAFRMAQRRRRRVMSVDKANVLATSQLWREVVIEESAAFPNVGLEHMYVDACAMELVRAPARFDVILTENMFGDILSDEAAGVVGSIGPLPSASLGAGRPALYEPVHGSAPDIAGTGRANPLGAILSAAMMLRLSFGLDDLAARIEAAVNATCNRGILTPDLGGTATTAEVGEAVSQAVSAYEKLDQYARA